MTVTASTPLVVGDVVNAPVKSKWGSKTNITAALLAVFGILTATGTLPREAASPEVVGSVVTAGAVVVAFARTLARSLLA